jgi:hypothetical protein
MVAASGETDAISVRTALLCVTAIVAGLTACIVFGSHIDFVQRLPLDKSPEVLTQKAREFIQSFGYGGRPTDSISALYANGEYQRAPCGEFSQPHSRCNWRKGNPISSTSPIARARNTSSL